MGSQFTFYDYIDADGGGENVIKSWLNGKGKPVKAYFANYIPQLEASPPPRIKNSKWVFPGARYMTRDWAGFIELRKKAAGREFRLICKMHGRNVFLVAHGIHKGQNFPTDVSVTSAKQRMAQMESDPGRYRREHELD